MKWNHFQKKTLLPDLKPRKNSHGKTSRSSIVKVEKEELTLSDKLVCICAVKQKISHFMNKKSTTTWQK